MTSQELPEPKSSPGLVFTARLKELATQAGSAGQAALGLKPPLWYRPDSLTKTILDPASFDDSFSRQQQEDEFIAAVSKRNSFGTTTDLSISQLQGDLMACLERALRARYQTTTRSRIHPAARLAGHAATTGVITAGMYGYIVGLDHMNKGEKA